MTGQLLFCIGGTWIFFFSSRRRHTRLQGDWSSDVCSSDLADESQPLSFCGFFRLSGWHAVHHLAHQGRLGSQLAVNGCSPDRKSTRLNSSHLVISYAVFCLKKKNTTSPRHSSVSHTPVHQSASTPYISP